MVKIKHNYITSKYLKISVILISIFNCIILSGQNKPNIELIDDAVVVIKSYDINNNFISFGSGVIIDSRGIVVTNYHVIKEAYSMKIVTNINGTLKEYDVDNIISGSLTKDLVKLSINNPSYQKFTFLNISDMLPNKGDDCWAIGTPASLDYMNTVSKGLVSNVNESSSPVMIQTNAEITHGSSGGALINSEGKLIGITTSGDGTTDGSRASINFAIWIEEIKDLPLINKSNIYNPQSNMGRVCFFTYSQYVNNPHIYINEDYIGTISSYFRLESKPVCGQAGTITKVLPPGTYRYTLKYANGLTLNGYLTVIKDDCLMMIVKAPIYPNNSAVRPPNYGSIVIRKKEKPKSKNNTIYKKSDYYWNKLDIPNYRIGIGYDFHFNYQKTSIFQNSGFYPSKCFTYYFYHKLKKIGIQFFHSGIYEYSDYNENSGYNVNFKNSAMGLNLKLVSGASTKNNLRFYTGLGFRRYYANLDSFKQNLMTLKYDHKYTKYTFDYVNWKLLGFELVSGHFEFNLDYNFGILTNSGNLCNMINFTTLYRFGKVKNPN